VKGANANQGVPGAQETAKDSVINNPALAG
jgi:hypothetical protein